MEKKKQELLNKLLDDRCEMYGVINTIQYLLDDGFTEKEIEKLGFDENDIFVAVNAEDVED